MAKLDPYDWLDAAIRTRGVGLAQVGPDDCVDYEVLDDGTVRLLLPGDETFEGTLGEATVRVREHAEALGATPNAVGPIQGFADDAADALGEVEDPDELDWDGLADRWGLELHDSIEADPPILLAAADRAFALDPFGTFWRVWVDDDEVGYEPFDV